jgi:hypothetical protein
LALRAKIGKVHQYIADERLLLLKNLSFPVKTNIISKSKNKQGHFCVSICQRVPKPSKDTAKGRYIDLIFLLNFRK